MNFTGGKASKSAFSGTFTARFLLYNMRDFTRKSGKEKNRKLFMNKWTGVHEYASNTHNIKG